MGHWTDAEDVSLKSGFHAGLSASMIARQLFHDCNKNCTRNAVIGRLHRLGMGGRQTVYRIRSASKRKHKPKTIERPSVIRKWAGPKPEGLAPLSFKELEIPMSERKSIYTLRAFDCRWPIGDVQHADFHFCGKEAVSGLPYCQFHSEKAYVAAKPRVPKPESVPTFAMAEKEDA